MFSPSYIELYRTGELQERTETLLDILTDCTLCPHECRVNRVAGETGICEATAEVYVSSSFPHFGEEPPLVGLRGSGTIFLTHCNLRCSFCQNYNISHGGEGEIFDIHDLASSMLTLQMMGCHNINFVTPTHYVPQIVQAVVIAAEQGLALPLVYNTSGYDSVDTLKLLDGIIDIYMPDTKFSDNATGKRYTTADDYTEIMFAVLEEMYRQVGDLKLNNMGIAERGMIIRHLVMPEDVAGSKRLYEFISQKFGEDAYLNIMDQYRPLYKAGETPEIKRTLSKKEWITAVKTAGICGLKPRM